MAGTIRELGIRITGKDSDALKAIESTERRLGAFGKRVGRRMVSLGKAIAGVTAAGTALGVGLGVMANKLVEIGGRVHETASKFKTVFGPATEQVGEFLDATARKMGLTVQEGQELLATTGAMAQGMGYTKEASAGFSEQVAKLAGDLQSFNNVPIEQTMDALHSALTGMYRPLRQFGIVIRQSDVDTQALADTGKENAKALTQQERAAATLKLAYQRAGVAVGDLDRTSGSLANTWRRLGRDVRQFRDDFATSLLPVFQKLAHYLEQHRGEIIDAVKSTLGGILGVAQAFVTALQNLLSGISGSLLGKMLGMAPDAATQLTRADALVDKLTRLREKIAREGLTAPAVGTEAGSYQQLVTGGGDLQKFLGFTPQTAEQALSALDARIAELRHEIDDPGGLKDAFLHSGGALQLFSDLVDQVKAGLEKLGNTSAVVVGKLNLPAFGQLQSHMVEGTLAKNVAAGPVQPLFQGAYLDPGPINDRLGKTLKDVGGFVASQGRNIGEALMTGIMTGSGDMGEMVKNFFMSIVSKFIVGAIFSVLGIASPSKVGREIGRNFGLSIADGLSSTGRELGRASRGLAQTMALESGSYLGGGGMRAAPGSSMPSGSALPIRIAATDGAPDPGQLNAFGRMAIQFDPEVQRVFRMVFDVAHDQGWRPGRR